MIQRTITAYCALLAFVGTTALGGPQVPQTQAARQYSVLDRSAKPLVSVKILGEVQQPGVYELPSDLPAIDAIAYAGGPSAIASDEYSVRRGAQTLVQTNLGDPQIVPLRAGDTVYVAPSWKRDLPIYIQITTAVVSILTLGIVLQNSKK